MSYGDASEYEHKLHNGRRAFLELGIFFLIVIIGVGLYLYSQQLPFTSHNWKAAAKLTNGKK